MTTGQAVFAILAAALSVIGVLLTVNRNVKADAKKTGSLEAEVRAFALALKTADETRAEERHIAAEHIAAALARSDENRATNLRISDENLRRIMDDTVAAVQGYQATADELKVEMSYVRNMWAGERKLVTEIQSLREEIIKNRDERREQLRMMGLDIEKLKVEHAMHFSPRVSGPVAYVIEEGAPSDDWGDEGNKR